MPHGKSPDLPGPHPVEVAHPPRDGLAAGEAHSRAGLTSTIPESAGSSGLSARARKNDRYVTTYWRGGLGFLRWAYPHSPPWPSFHKSFVASPLLFVQREVMS